MAKFEDDLGLDDFGFGTAGFRLGETIALR